MGRERGMINRIVIVLVGVRGYIGRVVWKFVVWFVGTGLKI